MEILGSTEEFPEIRVFKLKGGISGYFGRNGLV